MAEVNAMTAAVGWVRTWTMSIVTMVVFAGTLVFYHLRALLAFRRGPDAFDRVMGRGQKRLIGVFGIAGVKVHVEGLDRVPDTSGYIYVSNHQSIFDVPLFGGVLLGQNPKYIAKRSLSRGIPMVSLNLRRGGHALIDRGDPGQASEVIGATARNASAHKNSIVLFPEGTRSRDGRVGRYKSRGLETLMENAPDHAVVPTAISGSWRVFEHNLMPIPYGAEVRIRFGDPIPRSESSDVGEVLERCRGFAERAIAADEAGADV